MNFIVGKDSVISVKINIRILLITYKMFPDKIKLFSGMSIDFNQPVFSFASCIFSLFTEDRRALAIVLALSNILLKLVCKILIL